MSLSTVTLALTFAPQTFPAGTALGTINASITGTNAANNATTSVPSGTAQIAFLSVAPDTYTISVQQLDDNGAALGAAVTGQVVVNAPSTVTLQIPVAVNATVSS